MGYTETDYFVNGWYSIGRQQFADEHETEMVQTIEGKRRKTSNSSNEDALDVKGA